MLIPGRQHKKAISISTTCATLHSWISVFIFLWELYVGCSRCTRELQHGQTLDHMLLSVTSLCSLQYCKEEVKKKIVQYCKVCKCYDRVVSMTCASFCCITLAGSSVYVDFMLHSHGGMPRKSLASILSPSPQLLQCPCTTLTLMLNQRDILH